MKYTIYLIFLLCSISFVCFGQEQLGLRTENYSGVNSILLNPANNLTTPFQWDINLGAVGFFVDNSFGGFQNSSVRDILNSRADNTFLATDFPSDQQFPAGSTVFDFVDPGNDKFAYLSTTITGPSFMLNFEKHSFGLFTNLRAIGSGQNIPAVFGYYDYKSVPQGENYAVPISNLAGMAWGELGLNYLFKGETNNGQLGIGFSLKFLQAYESFFLRNNGEIIITKMEQDVLTFENGADIDFGFTNSSLDAEEVNLQNNGIGLGLDIGVTYATLGYQDGYGIKLGLSILDIGKIKFENNTELHNRLDVDELFVFNPRDLEDVTNLREGLAALDKTLFNDTLSTFTGNSYDLGLPTAFSLQADVALLENVYINATMIQRIIGRNISVARGNVFALTPRYESRWISAFLPISVYNWEHLQLGVAARLAFITIGTENLASFLGKKNLTGTDFYAAIKINPFQLGWKGGGSKKGKEMKCYQF